MKSSKVNNQLCYCKLMACQNIKKLASLAVAQPTIVVEIDDIARPQQLTCFETGLWLAWAETTNNSIRGN